MLRPTRGQRREGYLQIAALREFCRARSFDADYFPGMGPGEANRFNVVEPSYFAEGAQALAEIFPYDRGKVLIYNVSWQEDNIRIKRIDPLHDAVKSVPADHCSEVDVRYRGNGQFPFTIDLLRDRKRKRPGNRYESVVMAGAENDGEDKDKRVLPGLRVTIPEIQSKGQIQEY